MLSDRVDRIAWDEFAPSDWELFSQMADREGVAPLMYWKLKDSVAEVPPLTFNFLRSSYYQTLAQNTLMYRELERILKALDEAGIPVIVLKGAALAATVYEDIGLRPMGDLDLLVKEKQFQEALGLMQSIGYIEEPIPHQEFNPQIGYDIHLWRESNHDLKVELHWDLVTRGDAWFSSSVEWVWDQAKEWCPIGGVLKMEEFNPALVLSLEASLLYQSAHLVLQHGIEQSRLVWLFDIHRLVHDSAQKLDRAKLIDQAKDCQWMLALQVAISQAQVFFATPLPENITVDLLQGKESSTENNLIFQRRALRIRTKATDVWELSSLLKPRKRIKYAISMIMPSPEYMRWRYSPKPAWLWPLYYPYRWIRMVIEVILTFTKRFSLSRD